MNMMKYCSEISKNNFDISGICTLDILTKSFSSLAMWTSEHFGASWGGYSNLSGTVNRPDLVEVSSTLKPLSLNPADPKKT